MITPNKKAFMGTPNGGNSDMNSTHGNLSSSQKNSGGHNSSNQRSSSRHSLTGQVSDSSSK